jgi:hypothetical protein
MDAKTRESALRQSEEKVSSEESSLEAEISQLETALATASSRLVNLKAAAKRLEPVGPNDPDRSTLQLRVERTVVPGFSVGDLPGQVLRAREECVRVRIASVDTIRRLLRECSAQLSRVGTQIKEDEATLAALERRPKATSRPKRPRRPPRPERPNRLRSRRSKMRRPGSRPA